jgi:hypothetical protein
MRARKTARFQQWRDWARGLIGRFAPRRRRDYLAFELVRRASRWTSLFSSVLELRHPTVPPAFQPHFALTVGPRFSVVATAPPQTARHTAFRLPPDSRPRIVGSPAIRLVAATRQDPGRHVAPSSPLELTVFTTPQRLEKQMREVQERTRRIEERVFSRTFVLARPASLASAERSSGTGARPEAEWWQSPAPAEPERPRTAPPAFHLDQIADNVMRQIDRRIGAWRERMGRS